MRAGMYHHPRLGNVEVMFGHLPDQIEARLRKDRRAGHAGIDRVKQFQPRPEGLEIATSTPSPKEPPMIKSRMSLAQLLEKHGKGDFLRAVAEAILQRCRVGLLKSRKLLMPLIREAGGEWRMLGSKERRQLKFFALRISQISCPTITFWPASTVLDLGWVREEVVGAYAIDIGRRGVDPDAALHV